MEKYRIAIVGRGLVGQEMIKCLRKSAIFWNNKPKILATSSAFQVLAGEFFEVKETKPEEFEGIDIAFFAGTEGEKGAAVMFAEEAIKRGVTVIDNGSDFRMRPDIPLVIPEINPEDLNWHKGLIANPNCSTIIMLMALWWLHRESPLKRVILSTYQAVSGSGGAAKDELKQQILGTVSLKDNVLELAEKTQIPARVYPQLIAFNLFPEIGKFEEFGFTTEEWKCVRETHKIFHDDSIAISATTVRVPVFNAHSESIYIETERKITANKAREILSRAPGIKVIEPYPTPQMASGRDEVLVGRIREDPFVENGLSLWVVGDNIRKGAALNAVQIGEELVKRGLLKRTQELKMEERFKK